jgi:NhaA family Na+:H+ antiporter
VAVKLRWAELPTGSTFDGLFGVSILGGIGFTMALFVAGLAFGESAQLDAAKIGVLSGSIITGTIGAMYLATRAKLVASRERGVPVD